MTIFCVTAAIVLAFATPDDEVVDRLLERAQQQQTEGDLEGAAASLREALEHGKNSRVLTRLGEVTYSLGDVQAGVDLLYQALNADSSDVGAAMGLAGLLLKEYEYYTANYRTDDASSQIGQALDQVQRFVEDHSDNAAFQALYGKLLRRQAGSERQAAEIFEDLLRDAPDDDSLHIEYLEACAAAAHFEEAFLLYRELEGAPARMAWYRGQVYVKRAHYYYNRQLDDDQVLADYRRAEECVLKAADLDPNYLAAANEHTSFHRSWSGWTQLRAKKYRDAWASFNAALGRFPGCTNAVEGLSYVGLRMNEAGDLDDARELYRQAAIWAPQRDDFWNNYGLMCRDTGQYEEGSRAYRRALELKPQDPRILNDCALMLMYHLDRDMDQAERWLIDARQISLDNWKGAADEAVASDQLLVYGDTLVNLEKLYRETDRVELADQTWAELKEADPTREEIQWREERERRRAERDGDGEGDASGQ